MATKNIEARIKNKRDTAANWEKNNPVLLNGEIIIVDTAAGEVRYKTGDGIKTYKQLPFDDEAIKAQLNALQGSIPDVSKYVIAEDAGAITDTVPETFGGHTVTEFVLKSEVVDNLSSSATNVPLSAKQGAELNGRIDVISQQLSTTSNQVSSKLNQSGGTMTGALVAQANANYSTRQVRNMIISTAAPSGGSNGDVWVKYKV